VSDSLDRARERRASLRSAMGSVESMLAAPTPSREGLWRKELGEALVTLQDALGWHIAATEGPDGLLEEIMAAEPRLAHKVNRARTDHERLRTEVERAIVATEAATGVDALREQVVSLLGNLVRHRQLGSDLVYEAYNVDIEAGD